MMMAVCTTAIIRGSRSWQVLRHATIGCRLTAVSRSLSSSGVSFLPAQAHRTQPWKNGLGVSRMIAEVPSGAGFDAVLWQVSVTEISTDCPFSDLPGLGRQFAVIEGDGVELVSVDETTGAA